MSPGLVVLAWSPRVAPGLLTSQAWDLLHSAESVCVAELGHPWASVLADAGVVVEVLDRFDPAALVSLGLEAASTGDTIVLLPSADGDAELVDALAAHGPEVLVVIGSRDVPGARLLDLVSVMDRLRSPGGCAWDADQTHTSLLTYLIEETYETVEAVETDDLIGLREELGDLLLQVVFHARIGEEHDTDAWSIDDVAQGITEKLVRRHPHVFSDAPDVDVTAAELDTRWDTLKAEEKGRASAVDGVPMGQPALSLAAKLHDRAARAGVAPVVTPSTSVAPGVAAVSVASEDELGDGLLAIVVAARRAGLDPEAALREAARRYAAAIRARESR